MMFRFFEDPQSTDNIDILIDFFLVMIKKIPSFVYE